jgi:hypothetical protein
MRSDLGPAEYQALRATIRERGSLRMGAILAGLVAWGALAQMLSSSGAQGGVTLVPLLVLAATFEVSFFIHTGVERIGRYVQVFFEEAAGARGWETTAMNYGSKFPGGLDPLLTTVFAAAGTVNFLSSLSTGRPLWILLSLFAHAIFAYRLVTARRMAASQRAIDLERFRALLKEP